MDAGPELDHGNHIAVSPTPLHSWCPPLLFSFVHSHGWKCSARNIYRPECHLLTGAVSSQPLISMTRRRVVEAHRAHAAQRPDGAKCSQKSGTPVRRSQCVVGTAGFHLRSRVRKRICQMEEDVLGQTVRDQIRQRRIIPEALGTLCTAWTIHRAIFLHRAMSSDRGRPCCCMRTATTGHLAAIQCLVAHALSSPSPMTHCTSNCTYITTR